MQTDSLFYELFQTAPALLFELIQQPNPNAEAYTFRSIELKQTAFRIDGVFIPKLNTAETPVYFVEVQFQLDERLYARLFSEVMIFLRQNPEVQHWQIVVIYGGRSCKPKRKGAHASLLLLPEVHIVYLDELAEADTESLELGLVRLIVEPPQTSIARARQLVQQAKASSNAISRLSASAIIEMIETIVVYKFPHLSWQEVEAMFGLSELKQTRVYQQGKEEGIEQGKEEGIEQGIEQGERSLITRQLSRLIGHLPQPIIEQLNMLSPDALEALGEALLDFRDIDDLNQWLTDYQT
ncbi:MAG: Rpn family recombination-promoting nuclease/putative transposase [Cyanobacteria bacterium J06627_8]